MPPKLRSPLTAAALSLIASLFVPHAGAAETGVFLQAPSTSSLTLMSFDREGHSADYTGSTEIAGTLIGGWFPEEVEVAYQQFAVILVPDDPNTTALPHIGYVEKGKRFVYPVELIDVDNGAEALAEAAGPDRFLRVQAGSERNVQVHGRFRLTRLSTYGACDQQHVTASVRSAGPERTLADARVKVDPGC